MEFNATFIVSAINFIIFSIIMNAIFYKPLDKIVTERQKFVEETNEDAKIKQKKAEAVVRNKELKIEKTKQDAKKIITSKADDVNTKKIELTTNAQKKAQDDVNSAKVTLNQSVDEVQQGLDEEVKKLADAISSKILGKV